MKFVRSAPFLIVFTALVILVVILGANQNLMYAVITSAEEDQFKYMENIVNFNLKSAASKALARAEMLVGYPSTAKLVKAKNREKLIEGYLPLFKVQQAKYGVDQAQFVLPPAVSLLRLQDVEKFGDDLSSFRPILVFANNQKKIVSGVAVSRSGPAIFGVVPITESSGEHLGVLEVGLSFGGVLDGLKSAYGFDLTLFMEEEKLKATATSLTSKVFNPDNEVGKFISFHSTNWQLMKPLTAPEQLESKESLSFRQTQDGKVYGLVVIPLFNFANNHVGCIVTCKDLSNTRSKTGQLWITQITLGIFALVFLIGVVIITIKGLLLRPLSDISAKFAALEAGDSSQPIESEHLCAELAEAADSYEKLRQKLATKV